MEWPNELVLEFLEYYENEPVIWNPSLDTHKNRNELYDAWKRIENKMGNKFSVTELKKKKDSLMASFRTCLKKVKDSCKSGAGTSDIYKPNWFAYAAMERFLRDKNQPRQTLSSEVIPIFYIYLHFLTKSQKHLAIIVLPRDFSIGDKVFCDLLSNLFCCNVWLPRDISHR